MGGVASRVAMVAAPVPVVVGLVVAWPRFLEPSQRAWRACDRLGGAAARACLEAEGMRPLLTGVWVGTVCLMAALGLHLPTRRARAGLVASAVAAVAAATWVSFDRPGSVVQLTAGLVAWSGALLAWAWSGDPHDRVEEVGIAAAIAGVVWTGGAFLVLAAFA